MNDHDDEAGGARESPAQRVLSELHARDVHFEAWARAEAEVRDASVALVDAEALFQAARKRHRDAVAQMRELQRP